MFSQTEKLTANLGLIRSVKELEPILKEVANDCGFPSFLLAWTRLPAASLRLQEIPDIITNFPEKWMERYFSRRYYEDDCVLDRCLRGVLPVVWITESEPQTLTTRQMRIAREAAKHGLALGISAPVHGSGGRFTMLSFSRFRTVGTNPAEGANFVQLAAAHIHSALWHLIGDPRSMDNVPSKLKPVEANCLMWAARGLTSREIGETLSMSERTVYFHVSNAMESLQCHNRKHAISLAVQGGLIQP